MIFTRCTRFADLRFRITRRHSVLEGRRLDRDGDNDGVAVSDAVTAGCQFCCTSSDQLVMATKSSSVS